MGSVIAQKRGLRSRGSRKSIFIGLGGADGFARCAVAYAPLVSRESADSALLERVA